MNKKRIESLFEPLRQDAMDDLASLVDVNSFSNNIDGLKAAADVIADIAMKNGLHLEKRPAEGQSKGAFHLVADNSADKDFYGIIGHFDTVHPPESIFKAFEDKGDVLTGPGVQDMKSGIVSAIYGLRVAREALGLSSLPVKVVFNCDEEIGSPDSRPLIEDMMRGAKGAFIFEGRRADGSIVTSRKGIIMGEMKVTGKAAHAGEEPQNGASAIVEAAHKIAALDKLTDLEKGITVTTGKIHGGDVANQIPDHCRSSIDIRFKTAEDEAIIKAAVKEIMETSHVPGCNTEYALQTARPAFVKTHQSGALAEEYFKACAELGVAVSETGAGGGSDGNLTAAIGVPTIDGVGPSGGHAHTHQEYIRKESFGEAVKAFALFLATKLET